MAGWDTSLKLKAHKSGCGGYPTIPDHLMCFLGNSLQQWNISAASNLKAQDAAYLYVHVHVCGSASGHVHIYIHTHIIPILGNVPQNMTLEDMVLVPPMLAASNWTCHPETRHKTQTLSCKPSLSGFAVTFTGHTTLFSFHLLVHLLPCIWRDLKNS